MLQNIPLMIKKNLLIFSCVLLSLTSGGVLPGSASDSFPQPSIVDDSIHLHSVKISWDEQKKVSYYRLRLVKKDGTLIKKYKIDADKTKKKIKKLEPDTTYYVRMRAHYTNGTHDSFSKRKKFRTMPDHPRWGVNFVRYFNDETAALESATQPAAVEEELETLGVDAIRQLTSADLIWSNVEPSDDQYDFSISDAVLLNTNAYPIVDLFSYQYADGTTPEDELRGDTTPEKEVTGRVEDYVITTVERFKDVVRYWEIGNEMAHWELTNPNEFPPTEQGEFLAQVADLIRAHDPDAVIVLPGLINITSSNVDDWLPKVVSVAGTDWFDVISYHDYNRWQQFSSEHAALEEMMASLGISDKPLWLTEMGTSSDSSNSERTHYPNSEDEQAADIFRRSIQAYAAGDQMVSWHTFIGNDESDQEFRYFGLINEDLSKQKAYYAVQLLTDEILPFKKIEQLDGYIYKITQNDFSVCYVAWSGSSDTWTIPDGMQELTSVVPGEAGEYAWTEVSPGETVSLDNLPILIR